MNNSDSDWLAKPLDQIVGPITFAAIHELAAATAYLVHRGTLDLSGPIHEAISLTESRPLSDDQVAQLKRVLSAPESYWRGDRVYRRLPPQPEIVIVCVTLSAHDLIVAVDLRNPSWRIDCGRESFWDFMYADQTMRSIAKELFSEFASPHKQSMWRRGALPVPDCGPGPT